jgi:hypothetical protein
MKSGRSFASRTVPTHTWRPRIGLLICLVAGMVLLLVAQRGERGRVPDDPSYKWFLSFPGTPPGARFNTKPGDNLALVLGTVLPPDESQWKAILAAEGEIRIGISCRVQRQVPLWTRIRWWRMDRIWRRRTTVVAVGLPAITLRTLLLRSSAYEVVRGRRGSEETVAGPFETYENAKQATVEEIIKVIDSVHEGEEIPGYGGMHPVRLE